MTILEHLLALPGEYRDRAIANFNPIYGDQEVDNLYQAIMDAFTWGNTPEGCDFWHTIYNIACVGDDEEMDFTRLPPIPPPKEPVKEEVKESAPSNKTPDVIYTRLESTSIAGSSYSDRVVTYRFE